MQTAEPLDEAIDVVGFLEDLFWRLRREGFTISTAQAIDAVRIVELVGFRDRAALRQALGGLVVDRADQRPRFDAVFDGFFRVPDLAGRLGPTVLAAATAAGVATGAPLTGGSSETDITLDRLLGLVVQGSALDRLVWLATRDQPPAIGGQRHFGFHAHRLVARLGVDEARQLVGRLRHGDDASQGGGALAAALARELDRAEDLVRDRLSIAAAATQRAATEQGSKLLSTLTPAETLQLRSEVRRLARHLRAVARVRARRSSRGSAIDAARTTREAARTAGVPFELRRVRRRSDRSRLLVLCDVSESVRSSARLFLELAHALQDLYDDARTFAFVSDVEELTEAFHREPVERALEQFSRGVVARNQSNSNYGRALRSFERMASRAIDRKATVVVLGDGRTNFGDRGLASLDRIRRRARKLVWLCPDPRERWGDADSGMTHYAARCTVVRELLTVDDLAQAAHVVAPSRTQI